MSEQSKDAAERSAHVLRGDAPAQAEGLHPVKEWKTPEGKTMGQLRVVAEMQDRVRVLEEALEHVAEFLGGIHHHEASPWGETLSIARVALGREPRS